MSCTCQQAYCVDCGAPIPHGQGLAWSATDEEWTDRTKSRPISRFDPLCRGCIMRRMFREDGNEIQDDRDNARDGREINS